MRKIQIDQSFKGFDGQPLGGDDVHQALLNIIGSTKATSGQEAIRYVKLGQDLTVAKNSFVYEDADQSLLLNAVAQNSPGYGVIVVATLTELLTKAEELTPTDLKK